MCRRALGMMSVAHTSGVQCPESDSPSDMRYALLRERSVSEGTPS